MKLPIILSRLCLWLGMIALGVTVTLHLTLGLPPLEAGIADGFITKAPGMSPQELLAIWVAFSVIFYTLLAGWLLERFVSKEPSTIFAGSIGLAAIICAFTMNSIVPGHIAFGLLLVPGLLILSGTFLERFLGK